MTAQADQWQDQLFEAIKGGDIRQVGYVPDAGHARLIERCRADPDIRDVVLTTEEEGVAMAAGAWLGGQRSALLMQSSGVGNCINMLSLSRACRFPMLMLVTMRGEWEEFNPWQVPMGSIVEPVLKLCDAARLSGRQAGGGRAAPCRTRIQLAFGDDRVAAVLLSQQADRPQGVGEMMLERRAAMATLLADRPTICSSCRGSARPPGIFRRRRRRPQFLSLGRDGWRGDDRARSCAGEANARVAVITGDGEMLMGLGSLATIGVQKPANLAIVVFDNGLYGETGMQPSHTTAASICSGWRAAAASAHASTCATRTLEAPRAPLKDLRETLFARVLISADEPPRVLPLRDGVAIKDRFRAAVGIKA